MPFLDPEEQFRYDVDLAYAFGSRRETKDSATARVRRGPDSLASLRSVEGVDPAKVVDVTVDIMTDMVNELDGRELHPL